MPAPQFRIIQSPGASAVISRKTAVGDPYPEYNIQAQAHFKDEYGETHHGYCYIGRVLKDYHAYPNTAGWEVEGDGRFPDRYRTVIEIARQALSEAMAAAQVKGIVARFNREATA